MARSIRQFTQPQPLKNLPTVAPSRLFLKNSGCLWVAMRFSDNGVRITPGATLKSRTCTQLGFKYFKDTDYHDLS